MRKSMVLLALAGVGAVSLDAAAQSFTYVGKVLQGSERYAVVMRNGVVDLVRAGDTIDGYRVQSVDDQQLVVVNVQSRVVRLVALGGAAPREAAQPQKPRSTAAESAPLRVVGPSEAAPGEQFTLTVSVSAQTGDGSAELTFDPKVLQLRGPEAEDAEGGSARIELSGAGASVQFRVVARAPTATEIRVVADEGQAAHRLAIVPKSTH